MSLFSKMFGLENAPRRDAGRLPGGNGAGEHLSPERVVQFKRGRFNPIAGLTPELLGSRLASWQAGYLRDFVLMAEQMIRRDLVLMGVVPKRMKDVARQGFVIQMRPAGADRAMARRAQEHRDVLQWFWDHATATEALERDKLGGVRLLFSQQQNAVGFGRAVHDIAWRPAVDPLTGAPRLTASFTHVPLWFFESLTERLRFLSAEGSYEGVAMAAGEWLVTCGDGLMEAGAVGYLFKSLPLKDWLIYCQRFGLPYVAGKTNATKGSAAWEAMRQAVDRFIGDGGAVMNREEIIELITATAQGEMPQSRLVEYIDKHLTALWRGGDLGTQSGKGGHVGAMAQMAETDILVQDDADAIEESLQQGVEPFVIQYFFGPDEKPLAFIELKTPQRRDTQLDLAVDTFLLGTCRLPLPQEETLARYQRRAADEGEDAIEPPVQTTAPAAGAKGGEGEPTLDPQLENTATSAGTVAQEAAHKNTALTAATLRRVAAGLAGDLAPLRRRLEVTAALPDVAAMRASLRSMLVQTPALARALFDAPSDAAAALGEGVAAGLANGIAQGAAERTLPAKTASP